MNEGWLYAQLDNAMIFALLKRVRTIIRGEAAPKSTVNSLQKVMLSSTTTSQAWNMWKLWSCQPWSASWKRCEYDVCRNERNNWAWVQRLAHTLKDDRVYLNIRIVIETAPYHGQTRQCSTRASEVQFNILLVYNHPKLCYGHLCSIMQRMPRECLYQRENRHSAAYPDSWDEQWSLSLSTVSSVMPCEYVRAYLSTCPAKLHWCARSNWRGSPGSGYVVCEALQ